MEFRISDKEAFKDAVSDEQGGLYTPSGKVFLKCSETATSYTIKDGVNAIYHKAFQSCKLLENVYIPDGVKAIGDSAFFGCKSLKELILPDSVEIIGDCAFDACESLRKITIPNSVRVIPGGTFSDCSSLEEINLPSGTSSIHWSAFDNCISLKELTIPQSVTEIKMERCEWFWQPHPQSDLKINCLSPRFNFQDGALYSGDMSLLIHYFKESQEVVVPESVIQIGVDAFSYHTTLQHVTLPNSLRLIDDGAFKCCVIEEIVIPDSVTFIGDNAFYGCHNLKRVILPEGLVTIGNEAFNNCPKLEELRIPATVRHIGHAPTGRDIKNLVCLSPYYKVHNQALYTADMTHLIACFSHQDEFIVPDGVTTIGQYAFCCITLKHLILSDTVKEIGAGAFDYSSIKQLTLPKSVFPIYKGLLWTCNELEQIVVPAIHLEWCKENLDFYEVKPDIIGR